MKRADLVPPLVQAKVEGYTSESDVLELFYEIRETINIIWLFVGIPQVIPACLGLAGYLQSRGVTSLGLEKKRLRSVFDPECPSLSRY